MRDPIHLYRSSSLLDLEDGLNRGPSFVGFLSYLNSVFSPSLTLKTSTLTELINRLGKYTSISFGPDPFDSRIGSTVYKIYRLGLTDFRYLRLGYCYEKELRGD